MQQSGLSKSDIARLTGVAPLAVAQLYNGRQSTYFPRTIRKITGLLNTLDSVKKWQPQPSAHTDQLTKEELKRLKMILNY